MAILVTGGARSGKSRFAEQLAIRSYERGIYIATSEALDDEMRDRILKHKNDRSQTGFPWETIEIPLGLTDELLRLGQLPAQEMQQCVVLVDCLTLWINNFFFNYHVEETGTSSLHREIERLILAIKNYPYPIIFVTNELGDGIVPMDKLSRMYRDEVGRLNQRVAEVCQRVFLVTAGIPIELKSIAYQWEEQ